MHKHRHLILSLVISLVFATFIWQMGEAKLVPLFAKAVYKVSKRSFTEQITQDKSGLPMRYYPGIGTFYDPELIAREASRFYDTRIDPERLKGFIRLSDWIIAHCDSSGIIAQPNSFPAAKLSAPWYSGSAQTATLLALAKRAGYERDIRLLAKANSLLNNLTLQEGVLRSCTRAKDGSVWLQNYPGQELELRGMLSSLADIAAYTKLTGDSSAAKLFSQGVTNLSKRLPKMEKNGYLDDEFCRMGSREEHSYLTQLLQDVSSATPDSVFKPTVLKYQARGNAFVLAQFVKRPTPGRIFGFILAWIGCFAIAYAFLRAPK